MIFDNYWKKVGRLNPRIGALYIASKIIFGIGIGLVIASIFQPIWIYGIIVACVGILLMLPAEIHLISKKRK